MHYSNPEVVNANGSMETREIRRRFFFCKRGLPSPNISANHMARILSTSYVHVHVHTRTVNVCAMLMISYVILKYAPYDWLKCNPRLQKKNRNPECISAFE